MRQRLLKAAELLGAAALLTVLLVPLARTYEPLSIRGGSMVPALYPGDLVVVRRGGSASFPGTIVAFDTEAHGRVVHRVTRPAGMGGIWTRGDANAVADFRPVAARAIRGPVVAVVPLGRVLAKWRIARPGARLSSQSNSARR